MKDTGNRLGPLDCLVSNSAPTLDFEALQIKVLFD